MKIANLLVVTLLFSSVTACNLQPKYETPASPVALQDETSQPLLWSDFFQSADLQKIIRVALKNNQDLKIANLRINEAIETHTISKSNFLPSFNATSSVARQGVPSAFAAFSPETIYRANLSLSAYEIDFFGRLRNIKESALQDFLATREARNILHLSLIGQVSSAYIRFLSNKELLQTAHDYLLLTQEKYDVLISKYDNGLATQSDLLNQKAALESALINYESYKKAVSLDKNALMLLVGSFDEKELPLRGSLGDIVMNEKKLRFTPSSALLTRPDIQQAEYALKGANANIGAARAAFFPSISLTGNYGYGSGDLSNLFSSKTWIFTPQINLPIFSAGRNMANLKISKIRKKIEIINYEKAIQTAFKEVLDDVETRETVTHQLNSANIALKTKEDLCRIEQSKAELGISSVLTVLDAKLATLTAKQNLIVLQADYLNNVTSLFRTFGGTTMK